MAEYLSNLSTPMQILILALIVFVVLLTLLSIFMITIRFVYRTVEQTYEKIMLDEVKKQLNNEPETLKEKRG